jgi:hypothetical protein
MLNRRQKEVACLLGAAALILPWLRAEPTCASCMPPPLVAPLGETATAPEPSAPGATSERIGHALRGVVVAVLPEKSAALVHHEEIPGVMAEMTMLLKIEPSVLATLQPEQAITARLVREEDGWWLRHVEIVTAGPKAAD